MRARVMVCAVIDLNPPEFVFGDTSHLVLLVPLTRCGVQWRKIGTGSQNAVSNMLQWDGSGELPKKQKNLLNQ